MLQCRDLHDILMLRFRPFRSPAAVRAQLQRHMALRQAPAHALGSRLWSTLAVLSWR
jgi:hypothetical protein